MADVQNRPDSRRVKIDQVGVRKIRYPVDVKDRENGSQSTVASVNMYVELPHNHKGTHMSRFIEILSKHRDSVSSSDIASILSDMKSRLQAEAAHLELSFPFFMDKRAPGGGWAAKMEYGCVLSGTQAAGAEPDLTVAVAVPVTTLCPCSREISSSGAHSLRGLVTATVRYRRFFWMEDLITLVEGSASSEVPPGAGAGRKGAGPAGHTSPRYAEDVVRDVALKLREDDNFFWFSVAAENFESVHNHSAYAFLEFSRDGDAAGPGFGASLDLASSQAASQEAAAGPCGRRA
ncbi:MAG: GTP cyclohydrolase, FolE2/MptA family [Deltaproteobacteria bacterium]|nr:GTP cyclohydrolase, FolE2/MptA family [Deltaproteobacteria bacterium]